MFWSDIMSYFLIFRSLYGYIYLLYNDFRTVLRNFYVWLAYFVTLYHIFICVCLQGETLITIFYNIYNVNPCWYIPAIVCPAIPSLITAYTDSSTNRRAHSQITYTCNRNALRFRLGVGALTIQVIKSIPSLLQLCDSLC